MLRWNNDLTTNTSQVIEHIIKNVHPRLETQILAAVQLANIKNTKKSIEQFIREKFVSDSVPKKSKRYWLARGWTFDEAYVKARENKQKNATSVYSQRYWLKKINPKTNKLYTIEEADYERNSRRPIRKEYWLNKGYSESDAINMAIDAKNKNNKKGALSNQNSAVRRVTSKRCIEYWVARGHSEEKAKELVSENQKYFSKEICIEKFGVDEGIKIWQERQDRWQNTLDSKADEEKARINRLKVGKGFSISKAEHIIAENLQVNGFNVETQFVLYYQNKKHYVYDIKVGHKIIEYHGDFWHSNPKIYSENFFNPRTKLLAKDKWADDHTKIKAAINQGFDVLVIWESNFKQNKDEVIKQCIQFLAQ